MLLKKVILLLFFANVFANAVPNEPTLEYECDDGSLIPYSWLCDNVGDCSSGKDEQGCNYLHSCRPGEFMCRSGECISAEQKCSGVDECLDGSDETDCKTVERVQISASPIKASQQPVLPIKALRNQSECPQRNATLYFINNDSDLLRLRIEDSPQPPQLFLKDPSMNTNVIISLAFKHDSGEMLFTSKRGPNRIQAVDRESNVRLFASRNTRFDHVAIDPVTKNIYYAGNGIGIGVCDKEVNSCVTLVEAESTEVRYKELILNPKLGQMLWIQEDLAPVLKIASMDGNKVRVLSSFEHVHAISLDADNEILYIAEEDSVIQLNLENFTRVSVAPIRTSALIYFNCDLYYVQRAHQTLQVYTDEGEVKEIAALTGDSFPFAIVSDDFKAKQFNPCQFLECEGVCVLAEGVSKPVAKCVCESCNVEKVAESSGLPTIWIIFIFLCCISIGFFAFYLFVHFRICPALSDKIEELCGLKNESVSNISNISVGFNNTALE